MHYSIGHYQQYLTLRSCRRFPSFKKHKSAKLVSLIMNGNLSVKFEHGWHSLWESYLRWNGTSLLFQRKNEYRGFVWVVQSYLQNMVQYRIKSALGVGLFQYSTKTFCPLTREYKWISSRTDNGKGDQSSKHRHRNRHTLTLTLISLGITREKSTQPPRVCMWLIAEWKVLWVKLDADTLCTCNPLLDIICIALVCTLNIKFLKAKAEYS